MLREYHVEYGTIQKDDQINFVKQRVKRCKNMEAAQNVVKDLKEKGLEQRSDFFGDIEINPRDIFIDYFTIKDHVITVAIMKHQDVDDQYAFFNVGVAICIPEDQFVKKIGREKAIGRAIANDGLQLKATDHENARDIIKAEMEDAFNEPGHRAKLEKDDIRPCIEEFKKSIDRTVQEFEEA